MICREQLIQMSADKAKPLAWLKRYAKQNAMACCELEVARSASYGETYATLYTRHLEVWLDEKLTLEDVRALFPGCRVVEIGDDYEYGPEHIRVEWSKK